ncbi:cyclic peptide export ABC transporter [Oxalobacteraceae bacterium A2-2]
MNTGLYGLLVKNAPNKVFISILLSSLAGLLQVALIPLLVMSFNIQASAIAPGIEYGGAWEAWGIRLDAPRFAACFFAACLAILVLRATSGRLMNEVVTRLSLDLKRFIYSKVSCAPVQDLEQVGFGALMAALTTDVDKLATGARMIPIILNYVIVIGGVVAMLTYLNPGVTLFILASAAVGIALYQPFSILGGRALGRARQCVNQVLEFNRGLIYGSKELKLNRRKRDAYIAELHQLEDRQRRLQLRGGTLFLVGSQFAGMMNMLVIGLVAFVMSNFFSLSADALVSIVMILLYLAEPMMGIVECLSSLIPARISVFAVRKCLRQLRAESDHVAAHRAPVHKIQAYNLEYAYQVKEQGDFQFRVGPVSAIFRRGQVSFITGGNGSGKSTLGKLLSLHYLPSAGSVLINDERVTDDNRGSMRQNISAIFTDFHLFPRLYDVAEGEAANIPHYMQELKLDQRVSLEDGRFSTLGLSDGQRKRIALLVSYLEDRDVYVFDEWAADQDPQFKEFFYSTILFQLRERGKIVIVITHDDRYFHLADQLIKMENGSLKAIEQRAPLAA